jgi:hypothetical protein
VTQAHTRSTGCPHGLPQQWADGDGSGFCGEQGSAIRGRMLPGHSRAFFFIRWGGRTSKAGGTLLNGRTWNEIPSVKHPALETAQVSG